MFALKANYDIDNVLDALYKVSKLIASCGEAHTIGDQLIFTCSDWNHVSCI